VLLLDYWLAEIGGRLMTEHEKLVEIIVSTDLGRSSGRLMDAYNIADNLIDNGVTILPYKVGDKIYYIDRYTNNIEEDTIKFITITNKGFKPILTRHNIRFWEYYMFGANAFLSKEEAEAAKEKA
jgi:hypothetical protein